MKNAMILRAGGKLVTGLTLITDFCDGVKDHAAVLMIPYAENDELEEIFRCSFETADSADNDSWYSVRS